MLILYSEIQQGRGRYTVHADSTMNVLRELLATIDVHLLPPLRLAKVLRAI